MIKLPKAIITHITNGNKHEERLVSVMGGTIIETESERLMREGATKVIVEIGKDLGKSDEEIIKWIKEKTGVSLEQAQEYLKQYGK